MENLGPTTTLTNQSIFVITDGFYQTMTDRSGPNVFIYLFIYLVYLTTKNVFEHIWMYRVLKFV